MAEFETPGGRQMAQRPGEEIWECLVEGRVFVEVTNHRGAPQNISVKGVGSRLRLTADDRLRCQERILDLQNDPFVNGMLRRVDADQNADESTQSPDALSEEDMKAVFELEQDDFESMVNELGEVSVRRLKEMAPVHATMLQGAFLNELIEKRYPIGGDTPTYREMMREPQGASPA